MDANSCGRECPEVIRKEGTKEDTVVDKGVWRIRYNNELCKLMGGEDIVKFIKAQRIVARPCGQDG
jgi:hypothetical protein